MNELQLFRQDDETLKSAMALLRKGSNATDYEPARNAVAYLFSYDRESASLVWKHEKRGGKGPSIIGREAGCVSKVSGYRVIRIFDVLHYAHRLIWLIETGEWPKYIDHINGDRYDNSFENLRNVTAITNCRNRCVSRSSSSGAIGVTWFATRKKWVASIIIAKHRKYGGYFDTFEEALESRKALDLKYGFISRNTYEGHQRGEWLR